MADDGRKKGLYDELLKNSSRRAGKADEPQYGKSGKPADHIEYDGLYRGKEPPRQGRQQQRRPKTEIEKEHTSYDNIVEDHRRASGDAQLFPVKHRPPVQASPALPQEHAAPGRHAGYAAQNAASPPGRAYGNEAARNKDGGRAGERQAPQNGGMDTGGFAGVRTGNFRYDAAENDFGRKKGKILDYPVDEARKRLKAKKRARNLIIIVLMLAMLAFVGYKFMRAQRIAISGNQLLSEKYVKKLSGVKKGTHIFNIDYAAVQKNIESDLHLEFARLDYVFPDKLVIVVRERIEAACFEKDGKYMISDKEGYIIKTVGAEERPKLPLMQGINVTEFAVGAKLRTDDTYKQSVMKALLQELLARSLPEKLDSIDMTDVNAITMQLTNGIKVLFGQGERLDEKAVWLANIIPVLEEEGKTGGTIDISAVETPVYRPAQTAVPADQ